MIILDVEDDNIEDNYKFNKILSEGVFYRSPRCSSNKFVYHCVLLRQDDFCFHLLPQSLYTICLI